MYDMHRLPKNLKSKPLVKSSLSANFESHKNEICPYFLLLLGHFLIVSDGIFNRLKQGSIWPLRPNQLNLAFLKLLARNNIIWPFGHFLAFFKCWKNSTFFGLFWKTYTILRHLKLWSSYYNKFSKNILPLFGLFSFLRIWPFWDCLWPNFVFSFFGPGNPGLKLIYL